MNCIEYQGNWQSMCNKSDISQKFGVVVFDDKNRRIVDGLTHIVQLAMEN